MSSPVLARADAAGDRFYVWKGESFYSVTTMIGGGVPIFALPRWYAAVTAAEVYGDMAARGPYAGVHAALRRWSKAGRAAIEAAHAAGELASIKLADQSEQDLALRFLKAAPERLRLEAANRGIAVHDEAEDEVLRLALDATEAYQDGLELGAWPAGLDGYRVAFQAFLRDWQPVYLATEATVFNRTQAYAGTGDAWMRIELPATVAERLELPRRPVLALDYKSGRAVHPEVGMQLSAYRRGEFLGGADRVSELEVPATDGGAVLHLRPTGTYTFRLVRTDDEIYSAFLFAREIYRWSKSTARTVLGEILKPSKEAAA